MNIPELLACPCSGAEQAPRDKETPQAKNHRCWQSDFETMYKEMQGAEEKMDRVLTAFAPDG